MSVTEAHRVAEAAARASYGRLVAQLASRSGDLAAAEDALSDAFAAALSTWPTRGVPTNPEGWLLLAARRRAYNRFRHARVEDDATVDLQRLIEARAEAAREVVLVDDRLKLLFVCAHPAIDEAVRTPLMLQTVLGLDAERIGSAFLVAPSTMGQRLVRAKAKIKATRLRFTVPDPEDLPERLHEVLQAVYAAYGTGWDDLSGTSGRGLTAEALFLGRLLVSLLPDEPEAQGLLALMLYCEARRDARRDAQGRFVPLHAQATERWDRGLIVEAEALLTSASKAGRFGRFQCEAAIQSVHAQRAITGFVQTTALRTLYDLLLVHAPSVGVAVSRAAVLLDAGDVETARAALSALDGDDVAAYQPYWVTRARLAELTGDLAATAAHLERALGLTEDAAVRAFLAERRARLG
ncbi:MAG: RNA polymerase sigma factor [Bradymonadia bacterium]